MEGEEKSKSLRVKPNTRESQIHTKERDNSQFPPRPLLLDLFHDSITDFSWFLGRMEGEEKLKLLRAKPNTKESDIHTKERYNSQFPPRPLLLDLFHGGIIDFN